VKPSLPKGTRDFSPQEMAGRNYILNTIRTVYERSGYQPIETPSLEMLSTLMGKYGDEGDKLIFKILNSGNYLTDFSDDQELLTTAQKGEQAFTARISEKALRYDLTVPFARYVVMHQHEITFPFKRYQIQPVWRADRPQKGRYREFYQCDADVIGSTSLLNEIELIQIIDEVFSLLGFKVTIRVNNRKLLTGLIESIEAVDKSAAIIGIIDKIDKTGEEAVLKELHDLGLNSHQIEKIKEAFDLRNSSGNINLGLFDSVFIAGENSKKGMDEMKYILEYFGGYNWKKQEADHFFHTNNQLMFDPSLARGLNYYTGTIFEVRADDARTTYSGSLLGGGRYDNLTGIFGLENISGVGISFGIDRIYDVMESCGILNEKKLNASLTHILFLNFGEEEEWVALKSVQELRKAGFNAELYPDQAKVKKQMSYADAKQIPFVAMIGSDELQKGEVTLKNMKTGEQQRVRNEMLKDQLSQLLNR
jgi:histidyl-tRNA synthetase